MKPFNFMGRNNENALSKKWEQFRKESAFLCDEIIKPQRMKVGLKFVRILADFFNPANIEQTNWAQVRTLEDTLVLRALEIAKGNYTEAAKLLKMNRTTFCGLLKRIERDQKKSPRTNPKGDTE